MRAVLTLFLFEVSVWAQSAEEICKRRSTWGPWRCPGDETACSAEEAVRYKCPEGNCVESSQCTSLHGFRMVGKCKEILEAGLCMPTWSTWTTWSSCSAACGSAERTRFRACVGAWKASSEGAPPGTCADPMRASEGMERRDCPMRRLCPRIAGGWGEWGPYSNCSAICGKGYRQRIRLCNRPAPQGGGVPCQGIDTQRQTTDRLERWPDSEVGERVRSTTHPLLAQLPGGRAAPHRICSLPHRRGADIDDRGELVSPKRQAGVNQAIIYDLRQTSHDVGLDGKGDAGIVEAATPEGVLGINLVQLALVGGSEPAFGGEPCKPPVEAKDLARLARLQLQRLASGLGSLDEDAAAIPHTAAISAIEDGSGRWDPCNRQACPYLKRLTLEEEEIIQADLRLQRPEATWIWSGEVPARRFDPVGLHCPGSRLSRVQIFEKRHRFPRARAYWTLSIGRSPLQPHNFPGVPLIDSRRLQITYDRLILRNLDSQDEGVYRFGYEYEPDKFATICFFAVYLADKTETVRSGEPFNLKCNARGLWPIIQQTKEDDWTVHWSYRPDETAQALGSKPMEKMWLSQIIVPLTEKDKRSSGQTQPASEGPSTVPLTLFDTEQRRLDAVEFLMSGQYVCTVTSKHNGTRERRFVTSSVYLKVIPPLTLFESLVKWLKVNRNNVMALFVTLLIVTITYILLIKIRAKRIASTRNMDEYGDEFQANLAVVDAKLG
ncbi:unnamed protein product [Schistocephalus solidus]|uniref:Ig-like domain-containing protein n=1 Tax=Schistocephalus solidus TaxID=70667 RepID=A0A183SRS4_SCHSO|nr:unnamed protein product [Schistocephalus solidus]